MHTNRAIYIALVIFSFLMIRCSCEEVSDFTPRLSTESTVVDFGRVTVNTTKTIDFSITNVGSASLVIDKIVLSDDTSNEFVIGNFPSSLKPLETYNLELSYSPKETGADTGSFLIYCNDESLKPKEYLAIKLLGEGVPPPDIRVDTTSFLFGAVPVGESSTKTAKIMNVGDGPLFITNIYIDADDPSMAERFIQVEPLSFPITVESGDSTPLTITYIPDAEEAHQAKVHIESNDPDEPVVDLILLGSGTAPYATISPSSVDFGDVYQGQSKDVTLTITNTGSFNLDITSIDLSGSSDITIKSAPGLPLQLPPAGSTDIILTYAPSDNSIDTSNLTVSTSSGDLSVFCIGSSRAIIDVDPKFYVFSGSPERLDITIKNRGYANLTISSIDLDTTSSPDFSLTDVPTIPSVVQPNSQIQFAVIYQDDHPGQDVSQVSIDHDGIGQTPFVISLSSDQESNFPPVADAGDDIFLFNYDLNNATAIELNGSGSYDDHNAITAYQWEIISIPQTSNITLQNADQAVASFVPDAYGHYKFQLTVTDDAGQSDSDTVEVSINP